MQKRTPVKKKKKSSCSAEAPRTLPASRDVVEASDYPSAPRRSPHDRRGSSRAKLLHSGLLNSTLPQDATLPQFQSVQTNYGKCISESHRRLSSLRYNAVKIVFFVGHKLPVLRALSRSGSERLPGKLTVLQLIIFVVTGNLQIIIKKKKKGESETKMMPTSFYFRCFGFLAFHVNTMTSSQLFILECTVTHAHTDS